MDEDYKRLFEKNVEVISSLQQYTKELKQNTKEMNDNFVLHSAKHLEDSKVIDSVKVDTTAIREELLVWLKRVAIIAFIAVGGTSIIIQAIKFFNLSG